MKPRELRHVSFSEIRDKCEGIMLEELPGVRKLLKEVYGMSIYLEKPSVWFYPVRFLCYCICFVSGALDARCLSGAVHGGGWRGL